MVKADMVLCEGGCVQAVAMAFPRPDPGGVGGEVEGVVFRCGLANSDAANGASGEGKTRS